MTDRMRKITVYIHPKSSLWDGLRSLRQEHGKKFYGTIIRDCLTEYLYCRSRKLIFTEEQKQAITEVVKAYCKIQDVSKEFKARERARFKQMEQNTESEFMRAALARMKIVSQRTRKAKYRAKIMGKR